MAFSDVIDRENLDGFLVVGLELLDPDTGGVSGRVCLAERFEQVTLPSPWGTVRTSGVIAGWGEFGYACNVAEGGPVVSDGKLDVNANKLMDQDATFLDLLHDYELHGGGIWIWQTIRNPDTGAWEAEQVFRGAVADMGGLDSSQVTLEFVDVFVLFEAVPLPEVSRAEFPDAPPESVGWPIPIVYGDHGEPASTYDPPMSDWDMALWQIGHTRYGKYDNAQRYGVPAVKVAGFSPDDSRLATFRVACHQCKSLGEVAIQEPEIAHPSFVHSDEYTEDLDPDYAEVVIDEGAHLWVSVRPTHVEDTSDNVTNPYRAIDGKPDTYAVLAGDEFDTIRLDLRLEGLPPMGRIEKMYVAVWFAAGGSETVYAGAHNPLDGGSGFYGGSEDTWDAADEGVLLVEIVDEDDEPVFLWTTAYGPTMEAQTSLILNARIAFLGITGPPAPPAPDGPPAGPLVNYEARVREVRLMWKYLSYSAHYRAGWHEPVYDWTARKHWEDLAPDPGPYGIAPQPPRPLAHATCCTVGCEGWEDDESGTYTGVADALIERGPDICHHFARTYSGRPADDFAGSSDFGSFTTARTELGDLWKLVPYLNLSRVPSERTFRELCAMCRAVPVPTHDGKVGMVVLDPLDAAPPSGYEYRHRFYADEHFRQGSFKCGRTSLDRVCNSVYVDFNYDPYTDAPRGTAFVTRETSDDGSGTRDQELSREETADLSALLYGARREFRFSAWAVRDYRIATALRNCLFDSLWRPRLWIQFVTGRHALDLSVGQLIRLGDEEIYGLRAPNPQHTYAEWDDYWFYVENAVRVDGPGGVPGYRVTALEAIRPPSASDWAVSE